MRRVLLVEDNPGDVELVRVRMHEGRGELLDLAVADSLEQGLAQLPALQPEVVLLDLGLPDTRGLETLESFRRAAPEVPLVILTGMNDIETAVAAVRGGADDYVVKGELTADTLQRAISYAIERRRLYLEARRAVESRDEIIRIVSHDIRNHLSTVMAAVQLFRSGAATPEKRLAQIERAATSMHRLIGDLIDANALENGALAVECRMNDAGALVDAAHAAFTPAAEQRGVHLENRRASGAMPVLCDGERIQQVLGNLIGNALKFTPAGGSIAMRCEPRAGSVLFAVRDTGPGIPEEERARIFDRFFRGSRPKGQGLGLGLTISRALVEAHRGTIAVTSRLGEGAEFTFTLPASPA